MGKDAGDAMVLDDLIIDSRRLWRGEVPWDGPVAFVDLDRAAAEVSEFSLPPCPVVGFGDRAHPLAERVDALVEAPASAETILQGVLAAPGAASVFVQLMRLLPSLSAQDGLTAESLAYAVLQGSGEHRGWLADRTAAPAGDPGLVAVVREGGRLTITLDRSAAGNAIDRAMRDGLYEALSLATLDPDIARVSVRAQGRVFSLGADLAEFGTTTDPATAHAIRQRTLPARAALGCADRLDVHVQGACVGAGLELAAFAHRLTAAPGSWFQLPELAMGILPGAGGCVSLSRRIGRQRTALLVLSGRRLSARRALDWGLIDALVDDPA